MSKGSKRRPPLVSQEQVDLNYEAFLASNVRYRAKKEKASQEESQPQQSPALVEPQPSCPDRL